MVPKRRVKIHTNQRAFTTDHKGRCVNSWNIAQCERCRKYVPSGHVSCGCGQAVVCTTPKQVIVEQLQRKIRQKCELLTTSEFVLIKGPTRGRQYSTKTSEAEERDKAKMALRNARRHKCASILDRWQNDDNDGESQLASGWTTYKVKRWDTLGSDVHTHHCTKEQRERD